jgi:lipopolysaccharide/colanic/teichoic acid biosynthesis glycosyltransferase/ribosomal protein S18 acetylase RimI-like enzyme
VQRLLDVLLSALALVALSPLLLPIVLALRATGEGEIFYVQRRVGRWGQPFGLFKFATMLKDSPNMGTGTITLKDDPRVLPFGHFLRRTKINELPQLLNVLLGDMSIVGPRPQTRRCFDAFPLRSQERIIQVRPGLSGVGSIVFRNEEELMHASLDPDAFYDDVIMPYKDELEEWFVAHDNLRTYLLTIVATAWVVLRHDASIAWRLFPGLPPRPYELASVDGAPAHPDGLFQQVAALHADNIATGFLSSLGVGFLALLYRAIDEAPGSVLLVECREGRAVGFIAGATSLPAVYRRMLRHPFGLMRVMLPVIFRPRTLRRLAEILRYGGKHAGPSAEQGSAELLSLAVAPAYRGGAGSGIAERLYHRLVDHFQRAGQAEMRIVVGQSLERARRFYLRMGAEPVGSIEVHPGEQSILFRHRLSPGTDA